MAVRIVRKRSPRAPVLSLKEALDRVSKAYAEEGRHPSSAEIFAQHLGYKSAESGASKQTLAALGYYGLLERPSEGMMAVAKSFEEYKFAPSDNLRVEILKQWLRTPPVFAELLDKFQDRLPSEATLKFELIQKGFQPATAGECLEAFIESVQFVTQIAQSVAIDSSTVETEETPQPETNPGSSDHAPIAETNRQSMHGTKTLDFVTDEGNDRIPVRLEGGRRAWLIIPSPFYLADKRRLISQIEFLLADDE